MRNRCEPIATPSEVRSACEQGNYGLILLFIGIPVRKCTQVEVRGEKMLFGSRWLEYDPLRTAEILHVRFCLVNVVFNQVPS